MDKMGRGWKARWVFGLGIAGLSGGLVAMLAAILWFQGSNRIFVERAQMARHQVLLVTRLELQTALAMLEEPRERSLQMDNRLDKMAQDYLASIEHEVDLLDESRQAQQHQATEALLAHRLLKLTRSGRDAQGGLVEVRALARQIAQSEEREALEAEAEAAHWAKRAWQAILAICAVLLLVSLVGAALLWQQVFAPLDQLSRASEDLERGEKSQPVASFGLREIRNVISHFNTMASAVEARVFDRTMQLHQANARLTEIDRRRRLFLAKAGHELRTPVTIMRGEAEVSLRVASDASELRQAMERIIEGSVELEKRIEDLLTLARGEDGELVVKREPVDLARFLREVYNSLVGLARSREVDLEFEPCRVGSLVQIDTSRLRQALVAVLDNALKFTRPDGNVTLSAREDSDCVEIVVRNQGDHLAPDMLVRIFEPYVQAAAGRRAGGSGLGLALARWIVEAHDGEISASNHPHGGLAITLRLPRNT